MALVPSIVARFSRLLNSAYHLDPELEGAARSRRIGSDGEFIALRYLQRKGWKLLYRNYRAPRGGEVDLVMRGGDKLDVLVFVEVKTRSSQHFGRPLDAVDLKKQKLIERGANSWLHELGTRQIPWRFDVVEVILQVGEKPLVTLVENAF